MSVKLTEVCRQEEMKSMMVLRRQIPLSVIVGDSNLMMLMDLNSKGLCIDSPQIRGKELEEFTRKYNLLSSEELHESLEIDNDTFVSVLNQCVQCVGCRRRVERLFQQLTSSGHPTLFPLVLKNTNTLSIADEKFKTPQALGTLLYRHHDVLNNLLESKLRNKTRCVLHSLDSFRSRPFSETWREVWSYMKSSCRDELSIIETKELHEVLDNYLKKHKFCQGCRTKIEKAYKILVGQITSKEKGFVAALYANIKQCNPEEHIHVSTKKIDFLDALIRRAEPEVNGSYSKQRERHAKTLEIAQEEVLTCVGMIMYERLRRIYVSLREEDRACQVLAAVGVHALCRSFDMSVEKKQGISNLELLYQEISRAEKAKEHKREQKKLKKKKKKNEKRNSYRMCEMNDSDTAEADEDPDEAVDVGTDDDNLVAAEEENSETEEHESAIVETITLLHADVSGGDNKTLAVEKLETETGQLFTGVQLQRKENKSLSPSKQKQKQKAPQKRNKKKQTQHSVKAANNVCSANNSIVAEREVTLVPAAIICGDCLAPKHDCPCENDVKDSGYGSEPNSRTSSLVSSPEGSEVSCSDGFCNHEHDHGGAHDIDDDHSVHHCENEACESLLCQQRMNMLSLQQMLDDGFDGYNDEDDGNCYIPQEVVLKYQRQQEKVQQQRQLLRETLKQNFARLCMQKGVNTNFNTASCK